MGAFLSYSLTSGLFMLAMYLAYRLFMARDNQHGFNRGILLMIYLISFTTPVIILLIEKINGFSASRTPAMQNIEIVADNVDHLSTPIWGTVLIWIFIAGMLVVAIKTVVTWLKLTGVIRKGTIIKQDRYTLVVTDNEKYAPFSWMRYIVISRYDFENNFSAITAHELKHVCSYHWVDLLIAQVVCIVNWFNPASWLMRDELMLVHEYQADMAVIDNGHNPQEYQMLLIKKAVGSRFPSLANSLNHSKLKKRITMMYKEKSCAGRRLKALALAPMLALALCVIAVPAVQTAASAISRSDVSLGKGSENPSQSNTRDQRFKVVNININNTGSEIIVEATGEVNGSNLTVSDATFTNDDRSYQAKSMGCDMKNGVATVTATFPFSDEYKNAKMILNVNGEEVQFNLENFDSSKAHVVVVRGDTNPADTTTKTIVLRGNSSSTLSTLGDVKCYLDGEEISSARMRELNPDVIGSITVDKTNNTLQITSKK